MTDRYEPHCDCLGGHVSMRPDPNGRWRRADEGWKDISTAPRDGTAILTYSNDCTETESQMVMWWSDAKAERCGFGWEAYGVDHMLDQNHWRPIPAPPTAITTEANHA